MKFTEHSCGLYVYDTHGPEAHATESQGAPDEDPGAPHDPEAHATENQGAPDEDPGAPHDAGAPETHDGALETQGATATPNPPASTPVNSYSFINTVQNNKAHFTRREIEGADKAMLLLRTIGYPEQHDFEYYLRNNLIRNSPLTADDARRAVHIYGRDLGAIKGKTTRGKAIPQGALFRKFRAVLLGQEHVSYLSLPEPAPTQERVESGTESSPVSETAAHARRVTWSSVVAGKGG
jgi:hypothetical protein